MVVFLLKHNPIGLLCVNQCLFLIHRLWLMIIQPIICHMSYKAIPSSSFKYIFFINYFLWHIFLTSWFFQLFFWFQLHFTNHPFLIPVMLTFYLSGPTKAKVSHPYIKGEPYTIRHESYTPYSWILPIHKSSQCSCNSSPWQDWSHLQLSCSHFYWSLHSCSMSCHFTTFSFTSQLIFFLYIHDFLKH